MRTTIAAVATATALNCKMAAGISKKFIMSISHIFLVKHKNNLSGGNITKYFVLSSLFLAFFVFFLCGVFFMRKGEDRFGEENGRGGAATGDGGGVFGAGVGAERGG